MERTRPAEPALAKTASLQNAQRAKERLISLLESITECALKTSQPASAPRKSSSTALAT